MDERRSGLKANEKGDDCFLHTSFFALSALALRSTAAAAVAASSAIAVVDGCRGSFVEIFGVTQDQSLTRDAIKEVGRGQSEDVRFPSCQVVYVRRQCATLLC